MQKRDYFLHERGKSSKDRCMVTEGIRKVFNWFANSVIKSGGLKELEFGGTCISGRGVGVD